MEGMDMRIDIDLRGSARDEQVEFWQGVTPSAYRVARMANRTALDIKTTIWATHDSLHTHFSAGPHRIIRDRPHKKRALAPFVKLRIYDRGGADIHHAQGISRMRPGDVHVIDQSRPWAADHGAHDQKSIFIPHASIGYDPSEHSIVRTLAAHTPDGLFLKHAVELDFQRLASGADASESLPYLITLALRGELSISRSPTVVAARNEALRHHVATFDSEGFIGAEELSRAFGVSRATVFRAFEADGGLRRYQYQSKLHAVHEVLTNGPALHGAIGQLATKFGFSSTAHLSNSFIDEFGVRPSTVSQRSSARDVQHSITLANDPTDLFATQALARDVYLRMTG
jgi:AraC-like DNA-binding protein